MWVQRAPRGNLIGCPRHAACSSAEAMSSEVKDPPRITKEQDIWVVRFERSGRKQEYRCATEAQARSLVNELSKPIAA
jgi:hypothetical protein